VKLPKFVRVISAEISGIDPRSIEGNIPLVEPLMLTESPSMENGFCVNAPILPIESLIGVIKPLTASLNGDNAPPSPNEFNGPSAASIPGILLISILSKTLF